MTTARTTASGAPISRPDGRPAGALGREPPVAAASPDGGAGDARLDAASVPVRRRRHGRSSRGWTAAALGLACAGAMAASFVLAPSAMWALEPPDSARQLGAAAALLTLLPGVMAAALVPVLLAIAIIDARHFLIPDELNAVGFGLGLAVAGLVAGLDGMLAAGLRAGLAALAFLALRLGFRALRGRDGLGLGDVKLAAVAGAWLDPLALALAIELAAVSALAVVGVRRLAGRRLRRGARLPFGLFLAPAIWVAWALDQVSGGLADALAGSGDVAGPGAPLPALAFALVAGAALHRPDAVDNCAWASDAAMAERVGGCHRRRGSEAGGGPGPGEGA